MNNTISNLPGFAFDDNCALKIKKEPEEVENDNFISISDIKEEIIPIRTIVLKFKKENNGNYSVIPLLKPDPFFEENIEHLEEDDKSSIIKTEMTENLNENKINTKTTISSDRIDETTNQHKCTKCTFYTENANKLKRHTQRVHPRKTKSCTFCDKKGFKEPISLQMHILIHHKDNEQALKLITRPIFSCKLCPYKSLKKNNYGRHFLTHQSKEERTNKKFFNNNKNNNKPNKYNCYHCPYGSNEKGSIIKHVRLHKPSEYKPFLCTECSKKCNEKSSLDAHIIKHHLNNKELLRTITNRIYECDFCQYKDVNKSKIFRHKKRHFKKKFIKCKTN